MPLDVEDVVSFLASLAEDANMQVMVKETLKGGAIAFTTTVLGGVLFGPVGMAAGGAVGGLTAAAVSKGRYKPVCTIIALMDKDEKEKLYQSVVSVINKLSVQDMTQLKALVQGEPEVRTKLLGKVQQYIEGTMQLQIVD